MAAMQASFKIQPIRQFFGISKKQEGESQVKPPISRKRSRSPSCEEITITKHLKRNSTLIEIHDIGDGETPAATSSLDQKAQVLFPAAIIDLTDDQMTTAQLRTYLRRLSVEENRSRKQELDARHPVSSHVSTSPLYKCVPGKTVELQDETFLHITLVLRDGYGKYFVRGQQLIRENFIGAMMPSNRRNEVVIVEKKQLQTDGPVLHEVSVDQVLKNRELVFTNQKYPLVSSRTDDSSPCIPGEDVKFGPLFCRWKYTQIVDRNDRCVENVLQHLRAHQVPGRCRLDRNSQSLFTRIDEPTKRNNWRGRTTPLGGSDSTRQCFINADGNSNSSIVKSYTFGDAFCGAGGASRGATDAMLKVRWGLDCNAQAMSSYSMNFRRHGADLYFEDVHDFIQKLNDERLELTWVDVLHVSPPCQPFSPAHTIPNARRDEMNQAALPSVHQLIEKLKPRVVTMEETEGLFSRHVEWFDLAINIFTSLGYSVRWKILQCSAFGVPQSRKRLVIIAAGYVYYCFSSCKNLRANQCTDQARVYPNSHSQLIPPIILASSR
jgi:DNA (cytosine-5)-methyltransferase 1